MWPAGRGNIRLRPMKDYIDYLQNVLGIKTAMFAAPVAVAPVVAGEVALATPAFFYSPRGPLVEGQTYNQAKLAIVNWVHDAKDSLFETETSDLFQKMFAAMKIAPSDVLIVDCVMNERQLIPNELYKIASPQVVLFFCTDPANMGEFQVRGPARWLETLSPAFLVQNPNAKKAVWNDLQKVMRELT